ncbi:amidohydrolase family protein, partial [Undibacterium sp.]|uniref:amidohydrolase family protein n=1 Tax=Undibacterium sp. TaxID=1914977 RepID=UPI00374D7004
MSTPSTTQAYRASLLHFTDDPLHNEQGMQWHEDGLLVIQDGRVQAAGDYAQLKASLPADVEVAHFPGKIIMPGFIDSHIHYPQTDMIASPAPGLLPWLEKYTFPTERQFQNPEHAAEVASFFVDELLRCGTTTAMVYCT